MKTKAYIYIIPAGILWGTSGLFVAALSPYGFSSLQMTAMRGVVSAVCMALYCLFLDKSLFRAKPSEFIMFALSGLAMFGTASFYYISMRASSVSTAVVLMYTAPIIVMVYSVIFLGEKLTKMKLCAVFFMLLGCALVSGIIGGFRFDGWGIAAGFAAGISYASYNILTKIQMRKGARPQSASLYCFIFMAILATIFGDPAGIVSLTTPSPLPIIPLIIGIGVVTTVLPYLLYTFALRELDAGTASTLGIVEPMSATVFSITLLSEKPGVFSIVGIILIIGAVFILGKSENSKSEEKK